METEPSNEDLILKAIPKLKASAKALTKTVEDAEDLLQATLEKLLTHGDRYEKKSGSLYVAWANTVMRNIWFDVLRKNTIETIALTVKEAKGTIGYNIEVAGDEGRYTDHIFMSKVIRYVYTMPNNEALILRMEGYTYEEIATLLGIELNTAKSRVFIIRRRVQDFLQGKKIAVTGKHKREEYNPAINPYLPYETRLRIEEIQIKYSL